MTWMPTRASAPGKLVLAGEYAVLEPGEPALAVAVDWRIHAMVRPAPDYRFTSESLGLVDVKASWDCHDYLIEGRIAPETQFASRAVSVALRLLQARGFQTRPFELVLQGAFALASGTKVGLGGSAAVTVAIMGALMGAAGQNPTAEEIYKLAALAHAEAQGSGSGLDVATSVLGGVVHFVSHDAAWVETARDRMALTELVQTDWPLLGMQRLSWPESLFLAVGWTGTPASTRHHIEAYRSAAERRSSSLAGFLIHSRQAVGNLAQGLEAGHAGSCLGALARARGAIHRLEEATGLTIETPILFQLAEAAMRHGGVGKSSGAGGGDCGVAILADRERWPDLQEAWRTSGIEPLQLAPATHGLAISGWDLKTHASI
jgi:phosphomevalonate kinase